MKCWEKNNSDKLLYSSNILCYMLGIFNEIFFQSKTVYAFTEKTKLADLQVSILSQMFYHTELRH